MASGPSVGAREYGGRPGTNFVGPVRFIFAVKCIDLHGGNLNSVGRLDHLDKARRVAGE